MVLKDIKTLLGIEDDALDNKLKVIINIIETRLAGRLGEEFIPPELDYIVTEVAVARFNRLGSEGYLNHSVEGETIAISNDDFKPYENDINEYLKNKGTEKLGGKRGGFKFL